MTPKRNVHWAVDYFVILLLQIASAIASLVLLSIGLAVIFGMMQVVNLAHGEFLMLSGYAAITAAGLRRPALQAGDLHGRRRLDRPQSRLGAVVVGAEGLTALTVRALRYLAGKRRGAAHEPTAQERTSRP